MCTCVEFMEFCEPLLVLGSIHRSLIEPVCFLGQEFDEFDEHRIGPVNISE